MSKLFFSYCHKDEQLRDALAIHLSGLRRQGLIEPWHDRKIIAGDELDKSIDTNLKAADIILLLVSPDFLNSDYCYGVEMAESMRRHEEGSARVIPIILRPCDWHATPFGKLLAAPTDGKPVTTWTNEDEALLSVVKSIRMALKPSVVGLPATEVSSSKSRPFRPVNLQVPTRVTEADKDDFVESVFEQMAVYFQNSLNTLDNENSDINSRFKRLDANRFTSTVYRNGQAVCRCKIVLGSTFGKGISYRSNDQADDTSINENLTVESDGESLYLKGFGTPTANWSNLHRLSAEDATRYYWSLFLGQMR